MMPLSVSPVTRAVCALTTSALFLAGGTLSAEVPNVSLRSHYSVRIS